MLGWLVGWLLVCETERVEVLIQFRKYALQAITFIIILYNHEMKHVSLQLIIIYLLRWAIVRKNINEISKNLEWILPTVEGGFSLFRR